MGESALSKHGLNLPQTGSSIKGFDPAYTKLINNCFLGGWGVGSVPACGFKARFLPGIPTDEFMVCLFGMLAVNSTCVCYISTVEKWI